MIWTVCTFRAGLRTKDGRSLAQAMDDHARELRRANELLVESIKRQGP
jgi:hypothetical protein